MKKGHDIFTEAQNKGNELLDLMVGTVESIVDGVNGGRCPEFSKAVFVQTYPATLCLWPTDGGKQISIQRIRQVAHFINGYVIDYEDMDGAQSVTITLDKATNASV